MYYPKQVPYLLNKKFKDKVNYEEFILEELNEYCMCIWKMQSKEDLVETIYNNILPDACIDIVIDFTCKTICIAGFSKETMPLELKGKVDYMGVRLKPSGFYSLFHIEAYKVMDKQVPLLEIEKEFNILEILLLKDTNKRIDVLKNYLLKKIEKASKKDFIKLVDELYEKPKEQTVIDIAEKLGYNQRHLFRIFKINYGLSPKVLLNILRLHLCLTLLLEKNMDLTSIAILCGFYDQSHFIRDIKKYTGVSPLKLLENYKM
mgnify:CR=1 FL=1